MATTELPQGGTIGSYRVIRRSVNYDPKVRTFDAVKTEVVL